MFFKCTCHKNTLTGPAICQKTTRHHAHLSLCAKSRNANDAKSKKWLQTSIWAIFLRFQGQISSNCKFFLEKRFHSNWRSYLVLTWRQKPKKSLEPFLRKIWKCLFFGLIWRSFREYLQIEDFFQKSGPVAFLPHSPLTSCKKSEKFLETFLRKLHYQPTNQPTNRLTPIL